MNEDQLPENVSEPEQWVAHGEDAPRVTFDRGALGRREALKKIGFTAGVAGLASYLLGRKEPIVTEASAHTLATSGVNPPAAYLSVVVLPLTADPLITEQVDTVVKASLSGAPLPTLPSGQSWIPTWVRKISASGPATAAPGGTAPSGHGSSNWPIGTSGNWAWFPDNVNFVALDPTSATPALCSANFAGAFPSVGLYSVPVTVSLSLVGGSSSLSFVGSGDVSAPWSSSSSSSSAAYLTYDYYGSSYGFYGSFSTTESSVNYPYYYGSYVPLGGLSSSP